MNPDHLTLDALAHGVRAAMALAEVAEAAGLSEPDAEAHVAALVAAGLVVRWELHGEAHVILTPLGAIRAGVRIQECGGLSFRWVPIDDPEPKVFQANTRVGVKHDVSDLMIVDHRELDPLDALIVAEEAEAQAEPASKARPRPDLEKEAAREREKRKARRRARHGQRPPP
jgi:hypothetical protein